MKYLKQSIGILVSFDHLHLRHAFLTDEDQIEKKNSKKFSNTPKEFWWAHQWIENQIGKQPHIPVVVILEAAGIYHQPIIHFLNQRGYSLYVILPKETEQDGSPPQWTKKAGKLEANMLASYGLIGNLHKWEVPVSTMRSLKELSQELIHRKKELLRSDKQLKVKEGKPNSNAQTITRLKQYIDFLKAQIIEIDANFQQFVEQDHFLQNSLNKMAKSQELNKVTLATLISESDGYVST